MAVKEGGSRNLAHPALPSVERSRLEATVFDVCYCLLKSFRERFEETYSRRPRNFQEFEVFVEYIALVRKPLGSWIFVKT